MHDPRHRHFTLIELLVVIVIIAILAALLLPALSAAKERGRAISCINTQRQLNFWCMLYQNMHDDYILPAQGPGVWEGHHPLPDRLWYESMLSPSVGLGILGNSLPPGKLISQTIDYTNPSAHPIRHFMCPSNLAQFDETKGKHGNYMYYFNLPFSTSYGYNNYLGRAGKNYLTKYAQTSESPSKILNFIETWKALLVPPLRTRAQYVLVVDKDYLFTPMHYAHRGGSTCAYGDGHVAIVPLTKKDKLCPWNNW